MTEADETRLAGLAEEADALGRSAAARIEAAPEREGARSALAALADAGLLAWTVPEERGGAAAHGLARPDQVSVRALCALREALAYHSGLLDVMLVMQGLGSYPMALAGRTDGELFGRIARGEAIAGFALTEPEAGSDLAAIATRAAREGGRWRLDGTKTFISNAGIADFYTVLARTAGAPGDREALSMFVVPAGAQGLTVEPFEVIAPHPIGTLRFEGVEVPEDHLLGREGAGLGIALGTLARFRTTVAAAAVGFGRRALDESRRHLATRAQFGKPLAANQGLRFDLAEMDVRLRAAQLLVAEAAGLADSGAGGTELAVARAKLYATEAAGWICDRAVQHHGGLGVKRGTAVERLYREVRALRIYEGTSEVQKLIIAKEILAGAGA